MNDYRYIGCFFQYDYFNRVLKSELCIKRTCLAREITQPHITFIYKPKYVDEQLFGTKIQVKIIGYGNNLKNEGLLVELYSESEEINGMISNIAVPHITISISSQGRAVDTKNLDFSKLPTPILIEGVFGGYTDNEEVIVSNHLENDNI